MLLRASGALLDAGSAATQVPEVVEASTADLTAADDFHLLDARRVALEGSLNTDAARDLADGERGGDGRTAYFIHTPPREAVVMEDVDTIVLNTPNIQEESLLPAIIDLGLEHHLIGDCLTPRTAEEAVYEGMKAGLAV